MSIDSEESDADKEIKKRILILSIVLTVVSLVVVYIMIMPAYYQNYAPEQPIPFSHKTHAGKFDIPCLYCHGSAEYAQFAAVPGVETCMNCHSVVKTDSPHIQKIKKALDENKPIAWVKVHVLPDFVYFNHARHVGAGLACQTCHGPVEEMERVYQFSALTMGWCVNCHRGTDHITSSRMAWSQKRNELKGESKMSKMLDPLMRPDVQNADVSCSTCHR